MTAFIVIGGIGFALLLISWFLDGLFDLLDGALSATALGAGLSLYGAAGTITLLNGGPTWLAWVLGLVLGALTAFLLSRLTKSLVDSSEQEDYPLIGLTGITTEPTWHDGEVKLSHPREINKRLAISNTDLGVGVAVRVIEVHGSTVQVEPITHP